MAQASSLDQRAADAPALPVDLGEGDDTFIEDSDSAGGGQVFVTGGDSVLRGGAGSDILRDDGRDDTLVGGLGADTLDSGAGGGDVASYADSSTSVLVVEQPSGDLMGFRGEAQGDALIDVERVVGSGFHDIMLGGARSLTFEGGDGDDRLVAGAGDDTLLGQGDDDPLLRNSDAIVSVANLFDGGDGFDIVGGYTTQTTVVTGRTGGTVRFIERDPNGLSLPIDRAVDRDADFGYRTEVEAFSRVRLDSNGDGVTKMLRRVTDIHARPTNIYSLDIFAYTVIIFDVFDYDWRQSIMEMTKFIDFTCGASEADANDELDLDGFSFRISSSATGARKSDPADSLETLIDRSNGGDDVRNAFYRSDIRSIDALSSSETRLSTDILRDVEGAIGTAAEDQFFGGARGEAFFGNGGDDYIEAAAGDDRLSFGVGQSLDSLVNFPGSGGSGIGVGVNTRERVAGSLLPQNQVAIASRLQRLNPDSATAGQAKATNTCWSTTTPARKPTGDRSCGAGPGLTRLTCALTAVSASLPKQLGRRASSSIWTPDPAAASSTSSPAIVLSMAAPSSPAWARSPTSPTPVLDCGNWRRRPAWTMRRRRLLHRRFRPPRLLHRRRRRSRRRLDLLRCRAVLTLRRISGVTDIGRRIHARVRGGAG